MNEKNFKVGDRVELDAGFPHMIITAFNEDDSLATCVWFDCQYHLQSAYIPPKALKPASMK